VLDQVTKALVRSSLVTGETRILLPRLLYLTSVRNEGAAFGLLPGGQPIFMVTSLVVLAVIVGYLVRVRPRQWPVVIALAMVTAGALGNLVDRALIGQVTDFLEFGFFDFPVFNVADIGIVCGVAVLAGWMFFGPPDTSATAPDSGEAASPSEEEAS
jgi:signal peptidase II